MNIRVLQRKRAYSIRSTLKPTHHNEGPSIRTNMIAYKPT